MKPPGFQVHILRRIRRNLSASPWLHLTTTASIAFALVVVGIFFLLFVNIGHCLKQWQSNFQIIAYLNDDARVGTIKALKRNLGALPEIAHVKLVSKEQALADLKKQLPGRTSLLEGLEKNPLPASLIITLKNPQHDWHSVAAVADRISAETGIDQVEYAQAWIRRFSGIVSFFRWATVVMCVLIVGSTVFICTNTIRLTLYARQEELEIMRLVGATDRYIAMPFYIQNMAQGLLAGVLALGLLLAICALVGRGVRDHAIVMGAGEIHFIALPGALVLLCVAIIIGWLGSYLSLRNFLRS